MVVDGEGRNLLDQLEEIDGRVEERWSEFSFEIDDFGATVFISLASYFLLANQGVIGGMGTYGSMLSERTNT